MCCMLHLSSNAFKSNDVLEMLSVEEAMTGVSGKKLVETERRTNKLNPQFWLFICFSCSCCCCLFFAFDIEQCHVGGSVAKEIEN